MKRIIGVRFKRLGKIYFFDPKWLEVKKGDKVIVDTTQGEEIAEVAVPNRMIDDEKVVEPLKKVLRLDIKNKYNAMDAIFTNTSTNVLPTSFSQDISILSPATI